MSDVKDAIRSLCKEMGEKVEGIVTSSRTADQATKAILDYVPLKVAAAVEGYIIDLYKALSDETLGEPIFQSAANANRFYALQIRRKIAAAYRFDVKDLQGYIKGKDFNEMNTLYSSVAAGAGGAAVGGVLLEVLSVTVKPIPVTGIIAGTFLFGFASAGIYSSASKIKKKDYREAVQTFMDDLEQELIKWVDSVIDFYNDAVNKLKATLQGEIHE